VSINFFRDRFLCDDSDFGPMRFSWFGVRYLNWHHRQPSNIAIFLSVAYHSNENWTGTV